MDYQLLLVQNAKQIREFNDLPRKLYRDDKNFVSHLDNDIEAIFDRDRNSEFKQGDARRWILYKDGHSIGKIAAFYNRAKNWAGIGFFDCINDQSAADQLFDVAESWLKDEGFDQVEAPVNFGERDKFWGLLVEIKASPSYQEPYNALYYQSLFENAGYSRSFVQTTSEAYPEKMDYEKFSTLASKVTENPEFELRHLEKKKLDKYVEDFVEIYNKAWVQHEHFSPLTVKRVMSLFKSMKPILREDLIWFTYANGEPVAFYVSVIDVNQIFKHLNGKMNLWAKLKFLWYRATVKITRIRGIVFGVIPEYQNRGLYSGMVMKIYEVFKKDKHLKSTELSWIGDFNPKMHALFASVSAETTKVHYTYQKDLK